MVFMFKKTETIVEKAVINYISKYNITSHFYSNCFGTGTWGKMEEDLQWNKIYLEILIHGYLVVD